MQCLINATVKQKKYKIDTSIVSTDTDRRYLASKTMSLHTTFKQNDQYKKITWHINVILCICYRTKIFFTTETNIILEQNRFYTHFSSMKLTYTVFQHIRTCCVTSRASHRKCFPEWRPSKRMIKKQLFPSKHIKYTESCACLQTVLIMWC